MPQSCFEWPQFNKRYYREQAKSMKRQKLNAFGPAETKQSLLPLLQFN